jgi:hypothetical protein
MRVVSVSCKSSTIENVAKTEVVCFVEEIGGTVATIRNIVKEPYTA